jgi:hypothetical protein
MKDKEQKINYELSIPELKYLPFVLGIVAVVLINLIIGSRYGIIQIGTSVIVIGIIRYAFLEKILIRVINEETIAITPIKNALFYRFEDKEIQICDLKEVDFQLNGWQMPYSLEFKFKSGKELIYYIPILTLISKIARGAQVIDSYVYAKNNKI